MGVKGRRVLATLVASITGLSSATIGTAVIAYEAMFQRYERPNYALTPGVCCFERTTDLPERRLVKFKADKLNHQGYYYPAKNAKGLIVFAHGLKSGADDYLAIYEYFVSNNFSVFSYDCTGVFDSEGFDMVGMCQSLVVIDSVIKHIKADKELKHLPLFVCGHSWGGYAAASVLEIHKNIKGGAFIAPVNNAYTLILEKGVQYAGKLALFPKPFLNTYQKLLFGGYTNYNGVKGINSTTAPVLIAHGLEDKTITFDGQSIIAKKGEITNPRASYYIGEGLQAEHESIIYSDNAINYRKKLENDLSVLKDSQDFSDEKEREFYAKVNHKLYSELNEDLFRQILEVFNSAL